MSRQCFRTVASNNESIQKELAVTRVYETNSYWRGGGGGK